MMMRVLLATAMLASLMPPALAEDAPRELMPDLAMFGEYGDTPDVPAIRADALMSLGCLRSVAVAASDRMPEPMSCPYWADGGAQTPATATLTVTPATGAPEGLMLGLQCDKRVFSKLDGQAFRFEQRCRAYGYRYTLVLKVFYGVPA